MSTRDDLAAVLIALRVGVLIPAPGLQLDQRDALLAEFVRMRHELAADQTTNVCALPANAFTRKADATYARGSLAITIAAIATNRDFARLVFHAALADPASSLRLLRETVSRLDECVTELLGFLGPELRAEVDSLSQRFRSDWPDDAQIRATQPVEGRTQG